MSSVVFFAASLGFCVGVIFGIALVVMLSDALVSRIQRWRGHGR